MEQHPVPQNISSYQFHLVGDMTLKQFLELGAGVLIAVLIYATALPTIIKVPLILFFVGMGAALAFLPLEERPLEQWIVAFFRSIYSPTLFHWEKQENVKYFQDEKVDSATTTQTQGKANPFAAIPFLNKLEESENSYLNKLTGLFSGQASATIPTTPVETAPSVTTTTIPTPATTTSVVKEVQTPPQSIPQVTGGSTTINITTSMMPNNDQGQVLTMHGGQSNTLPESPTPGAAQREIKIPQMSFVSVKSDQTKPEVVTVPTISQQPSEANNVQQTQVSQTLMPEKIVNATQAEFSLDAAPPSLPTIINTVSGQVMDSDRKLIEGAILEIVDEAGRPVRALRTNKAGHFLIVTPLMEGNYRIVVEKEGYEFEPIQFSADNEIIQPIAIRAK